MRPIIVTRTIDAPIETVFGIVSDIREFSKALPHVERYEILSDVQSGLGTRFRETRRMQGKEATVELEVTEFVQNDRVRLVADSHGAVWDTVFTVRPVDGKVELRLEMEARSYKLMARIFNTLFRPMIAKAVARDLDLVKACCEGGAAPSSGE